MDFNYNVAGAYNFNKDTFLASIDREGNIICESVNGRKKVGVDTQIEADMQGVIDNYYNKLCELGIFVKEKTPEEIAKENTENQIEMFKIIKELKEEIKEMKNNGITRNVITKDGHLDTSNSEDGKPKPTRSATGLSTSNKNGSKEKLQLERSETSS